MWIILRDVISKELPTPIRESESFEATTKTRASTFLACGFTFLEKRGFSGPRKADRSVARNSASAVSDEDMQTDPKSSRLDEPEYSVIELRRTHKNKYPVITYPEGEWWLGASAFIVAISDDKISFALATKGEYRVSRQNAVGSEMKLHSKKSTWKLVSLSSAENNLTCRWTSDAKIVS